MLSLSWSRLSAGGAVVRAGVRVLLPGEHGAGRREFAPADILGVLAYAQIARVLGPTFSAAVTTTLLRKREALHSALLAPYIEGGGKRYNGEPNVCGAFQ
jgi:hypothetical protein